MNTPELIASRANPKIKAAAALLSSKERKKTGLFLTEGARLCEDAALFGAEIETLFITAQAAGIYAAVYETVRENAKETYLITEPVAEKLSDTASSQNIFCVCRQKTAASFPDGAGVWLMTDRIQDPENLGALSRTAEAFGAEGLIVCGGCDIYAPKALRASMGALLRFPVIRAEDTVRQIEACKALGMRVYAAVPDARAQDVCTVPPGGNKVLLIGNEGNGVSEDAKAACTDYVVIPMRGRAESLNAAAAGAVLLWELTGRGR